MNSNKDIRTAIIESAREINEMLFRKKLIDSKLYESTKSAFKLNKDVRLSTKEQFSDAGHQREACQFNCNTSQAHFH